MQIVLTPQLLIESYRLGLFPMGVSSDSPYMHWICPEMRGQLPIDGLHVPRRLAATVRRAPYEVRIDTDFEGVMRACARSRPERPQTWINEPIIAAYCALYEAGHAHSVECWLAGELVGGVYGVSIGAAFFGESMFSTARDASKVALVHLTARLWRGGFEVFDTQFVNDHLKQFGVYEISHEEYRKRLAPALGRKADFTLSGLAERDLVRDYLTMKPS